MDNVHNILNYTGWKIYNLAMTSEKLVFENVGVWNNEKSKLTLEKQTGLGYSNVLDFKGRFITLTAYKALQSK